MISFLVHAFILLLITFVYQVVTSDRNSIEVTIVHTNNKEINKNSDLKANNTQKGGGTNDKSIKVTFANAPLQDDQLRAVLHRMTDPKQINNPIRSLSKDIKPWHKQQEILITTGFSKDIASVSPDKDSVPFDIKPTFINNLKYNSDNISSLQAKIAQEQKLRAKLKRIKHITSVDTVASDEAEYIFKWVSKVERIGTKNYPQKALANNIVGRLRLRVVLKANGLVSVSEITKSSGFEVLDNAALKIVKLSSPFTPFPEKLREKYDQIEMIRTWYFYQDSLLTSQIE